MNEIKIKPTGDVDVVSTSNGNFNVTIADSGLTRVRPMNALVSARLALPL